LNFLKKNKLLYEFFKHFSGKNCKSEALISELKANKSTALQCAREEQLKQFKNTFSARLSDE
jgi:hypothetical protein